VRLTISEYSDVRAKPRHFFTAPGHEDAGERVARVVGYEDGYVVIEKDPDAAER
jgi:hypothetical protein